MPDQTAPPSTTRSAAPHTTRTATATPAQRGKAPRSAASWPSRVRSAVTVQLRAVWGVLRAVGRSGTGVAPLRNTMVLLAVLPAALVCLIGTAAWFAHDSGMTGAADGTEWDLLTGTLLLACAVLAGGGILAGVRAREVSARYAEQGAVLGQYAERGHTEIATMVNGLRSGKQPARSQEGPPSQLHGTVLEEQAREINGARRSAETAVLELAAARTGDAPGGGEHAETFAHLARGLGSLAQRELAQLERLESAIDDPELLKSVSRIDHLATRTRRYAENLAVLGGSVPRRRWSHPVELSELLCSAIAEVEQYPRVKPVAKVEATVCPHAAPDVVHLLAELTENATEFSAPRTGVLLRAEWVAAGLAVEVEDRGEGMASAERNARNALLAAPDRRALRELPLDGRVGLYVVSQLARRHRISVRLQENIYGGTQAVLVLPDEIVDGRDHRAGRHGPRGADERGHRDHDSDSDSDSENGNGSEGGNGRNGKGGGESTEVDQGGPVSEELGHEPRADREPARRRPSHREPPQADPADETTVLPPVPADETTVLPPVPAGDTTELPPVPEDADERPARPERADAEEDEGRSDGTPDTAGAAPSRGTGGSRKGRGWSSPARSAGAGGGSSRPRAPRPGRPGVPKRPTVPTAPSAPGLPGDLGLPSGPSVPRGPVVPKGIWRDEQPEERRGERRGTGRDGGGDEPEESREATGSADSPERPGGAPSTDAGSGSGDRS